MIAGEDCSSYKVSQWVTSVTAFSSEYFLERYCKVRQTKLDLDLSYYTPRYTKYIGGIKFLLFPCVCLCVCLCVLTFFRQRFLKNYLT